MEDELTQLLARLEREWAPAMLDAAARIVFWDAVGWLTIGALLVAVTLVLAQQTRGAWRYCESDKYDPDKDGWMPPVMLVMGAGAFFTALIAAFILLNIWNWIALFDPRLAVAHRVLELVLRGGK